MPTAVIFTAIDIEYDAVRRHASDLTTYQHARGNLYEIGTFESWKIVLRQAGVGNQVAAVETERAIEEFSPDVILFVGVAGGLKDVSLGDVVVANQVRSYDSGKEDEDAFKPRDVGNRSSFVLLERCQQISRHSEWRSRIYEPNSLCTQPSALIGPIVAGEKVIASLKSRTSELIAQNCSDALAAEMEGGGFLTAAYASTGVQAIVVRGISDLIKGKSISDQLGWQDIASCHAAAFAYELLSHHTAQQATGFQAAPRSSSLPNKHSAPPEQEKLSGVRPEESPYIGPRPFPKQCWHRFFGREEEESQLKALVEQNRIVVIHAASGAGKSSIINTALHESLVRDGWEMHANARVCAALPESIEHEGLANVFSASAAISMLKSDNGGYQHANIRSLKEYFHQFKGTAQCRLLVLDQFEELFTKRTEYFDQRSAFFRELADILLVDSTLHVVISLRKDYLADIQALLGGMPSDISISLMALQRMTLENARKAIEGPARKIARYEEGLLDDILTRINQVKVKQPDGSEIVKQGEFIDLVHLQIVFDSLWRRLKPGIHQITLRDVLFASGKDSIDELVSYSLDDFFDSTIREIAESDQAKSNGGISTDLIRLGCMGFVTPTATRDVKKAVSGRVGRLPLWVIEQLDAKHLITSQQRGGQVWYELSHDRLADPVAKQINPEVRLLLNASELLSKVIENIKLNNDNGLTGHFSEYDGLIRDCKAFDGQKSLFRDEAEFLLRAAITSGNDLLKWAKRVHDDFEETFVDVMLDAFRSSNEAVRLHSLTVFEEFNLASFDMPVRTLITQDQSIAVQEAGVRALIKTDHRILIDSLFHESSGLGASSSRALTALSRIYILHNETQRSPAFSASLEQASIKLHRKIRAKASRMRFKKSLAILPHLFLLSTTFAAFIAASIKWIFGSMNLALCQATASAGMGGFHGLIAGVIWEGTIVVAISLFYSVFCDELSRKSALRPFGAIVFGALGGFLSSLALVLIIAMVYESQSLEKMGWTSKDSNSVLSDLFITRRFALQYLVTGTGLGIGVALCLNKVRSLEKWLLFIQQQQPITSLSQMKRMTLDISAIVLPHAWLVAAPVAVALVIAIQIPATSDQQYTFEFPLLPEHSVSMVGNALRVSADCVVQILGGIAGIVGAGIGSCIIWHGLRIEPSTHRRHREIYK